MCPALIPKIANATEYLLNIKGERERERERERNSNFKGF